MNKYETHRKTSTHRPKNDLPTKKRRHLISASEAEKVHCNVRNTLPSSKSVFHSSSWLCCMRNSVSMDETLTCWLHVCLSLQGAVLEDARVLCRVTFTFILSPVVWSAPAFADWLLAFPNQLKCISTPNQARKTLNVPHPMPTGKSFDL